MNEPRRSQTLTASRPRIVLAGLAVFLFATILYLPSLRNGFVWDDKTLVEHQDVQTLNDDAVRRVFTTNYWDASDATSGLYRPLTALSFHADYQKHGDKPAGFHLTNVLFNASVCALVFLVLLELFGALNLALITALFFAAFPMHTENVAWISGRTDVLATLFMLASLWCYATWRSRGRVIALPGTLLFFAAALLAKEAAIVLPALVVVCELLPLGRERSVRVRRISVANVAGMFLIAAAYLVLRKQVLGASLAYFHRFTHGIEQAVALSFSILAHYAFKLVFPFRLNAESDFPPPQHLWNAWTLAGIVILAATCYALYRWRRHSAFVFGVAVILLGLAPVLHLIPVNQVLAERFLYFPSVGFCVLVALGVLKLGTRGRVPAVVAFAVLLISYSVRTVARVPEWKDEMTLFTKAVAQSGNNARARASLGGALFEQERYEEAANQFRFAVKLNPSYAPGWSGLANSEAKLGNVPQALEDMQTALDLDPDNTANLSVFGNLQFQAKDYMAATGTYQEVLRRHPGDMQVRFNLGLALYQLGFFDDAVKEFTALENKDTEFPNAWFFLAESQMRSGQPEAAAQSATHFLTLHTTDDAIAARARQIIAGGQ